MSSPLQLRYEMLIEEANSDIFQHLPVLYECARNCEHITEFGIGFCKSSTALLFAQPKVMIGYDIGGPPHDFSYDVILPLRGITDLRFIKADTAQVSIEPTDLLFIDSLHTYKQLSTELKNAPKVRKYIILHDTETFADRGEDWSRPGLWQAVVEFLEKDPRWTIQERLTNCNGLTILKRVE